MILSAQNHDLDRLMARELELEQLPVQHASVVDGEPQIRRLLVFPDHHTLSDGLRMDEKK